MTFHSILSEKDGLRKETTEQPGCFSDLNLDQVINAMTVRKQEYNLKPYYYTPLRDAETIRYRHEVMRDLENEMIKMQIEAFAEKMVLVRRYLGLVERLDFEYHKKGWFLEAVRVYCEAVTGLAHDLGMAILKSRGLLALTEYLKGYVHSPQFQSLSTEAKKVQAGLARVKYCVIIKDSTVKVRKYEEETDYSIEVEKTFEKFKQGAVRDYKVDFYEGSGMNHVEAKILEFVARLNPECFAALDHFCEHHNIFIDETLRVFDREIQFFITFLEYIADIQRQGLAFCYPQVDTVSKTEYVHDTFDIALANNLCAENAAVICNDFFLEDPERFIIVTGPNQGGKTTFARTFGQLHYLASLGCPVPGTEARLFLFDQIFTQFEVEEDIRNLHGKLQDDLVRIHDILTRATPDSILVLNEIFSSTTLEDAVFLSREIIERVMELDLLGVWVTFIDELAAFSEKTVSMVSTVFPENPALRTFKIVRKPADGLAYALSIAEKHRLTYTQIKERLQS